MSYRVSRKTTSSTFKVNGHLCKVFLEPHFEYLPGRWVWNVGFAVGKSKRQLNDWYWKRKNKRARSLEKKLIGRAGIKTIAAAFDQLLVLRWHIRPGDALILDCTSGRPDQQFKAWKRWQKKQPDIHIDERHKEFMWFRPPYGPPDFYREAKRCGLRVIPLTPQDKKVCWGDEGHDLSFDIVQAAHHRLPPMERTAPPTSQAPQSE